MKRSPEEAKARYKEKFRKDPELALKRFFKGRSIPILSADALMEESDDYSSGPNGRRSYGAALYEIAAHQTDLAYAKLLNRPVEDGRDTVVFTAGGSASGKSSVLAVGALPKSAELVFDTTFSTPARAMGQVKRALQNSRKVHICYVYREFGVCVRAMLGRALNPKNGRVVNVGTMAKTHSGARDSVNQALVAYAENPDVTFAFFRLRSTGLIVLTPREYATLPIQNIDTLRARGDSLIDEIHRNQDERWHGGKVPRPVIDAARSDQSKNSE
ncbi:MAG: hypothetical protein WCO94_06880 [Verrucomicrobiota bacterium]